MSYRQTRPGLWESDKMSQAALDAPDWFNSAWAAIMAGDRMRVAYHHPIPSEDRTVSRPKDQDQDQDEPATQTRTLAWTGYQLTVKELRGWLDQIPNHAVLHGWSTPNHAPLEGEIRATWEVT